MSRGTLIFRLQQLMSRFITEMRHVQNSRGVIRLQPQHLPTLQPLQPFAGFQDRQRTEQAKGVKVVIKVHKPMP